MRKLTTWFIAFGITLIAIATVGTKAYAETLKLPNSLTEIQEEAFYGDASIEAVAIPYGTQTIGKKAFAHSGLVKIYIPQTVTAIADDAFEGVDDMMILAPSESYAKQYADDHDYLWEDVGNYYSIERFTTTSLLYEELETAAYGTLYLNGYESFTIDISEDDDGDLKDAVREYNQIEQNTTVLYNEYLLRAHDVYDCLIDISSAIEADSISYTESGPQYEGPDFTYSVSGKSLEGIEKDCQITSTTVLDNGNVSIDLNSNGKNYTLESSLDGITIRGAEINLTYMGTPDSIIASSSLQSKGVAIDANSLIMGAIELCNRVKAPLDCLKNSLHASLEALSPLVRERLNQMEDLEYYVKNRPPNMTDERYQNYKASFERAERNYRIVHTAEKNVLRCITILRLIDPFATISAIKCDWDSFNKLTKLYDHRHPTDSEFSDPIIMGKVNEMLNSVDLGSKMYLADAMTNMLLLFDQVSTAMGIVCSLTGVAAPVGLLQKSAIHAGTTAARIYLATELGICCVGITTGAVAKHNYDKAFEIDKTLHGIVAGTVTDEDTGEPIKNVKVSIGSNSTYTNSQGKYSIAIPPGSTTLNFAKQLYQDVPKEVTSSYGATQVCNVKMKKNSGITGTVRDAKSGEPIEGVTVQWGDYKTTSNSAGVYTFNLKPGTKTLSFEKEGYITWSGTATCEAGKMKTYDAALTEVLPQNTYRVVLTWGSTPFDLDSHLMCPEGHVYYSTKVAGDARLDLDDRSSYGPETITFLAKTEGAYSYYIHDFSNKGNSSSTALANSGATVVVYKESTRVGVYHVPQGAGTRWNVFTITDGVYNVNSYISS